MAETSFAEVIESRCASVAAGVVAPLLLLLVLVMVTVAEWSLLRESGWSLRRQNEVGWPSILTLGNFGWVVAATFLVCGLLTVTFATALYRLLPDSLARAGAGLIGLAGAALALVAFYPDPPGSEVRSWHGQIHDYVYPLIPLSGIAAAAIFTWSLWHQPGWTAQGRIALTVLAVVTPALLLTGAGAIGQFARFVLFGTLIVWLEVLALAVLNDARHGRNA